MRQKTRTPVGRAPHKNSPESGQPAAATSRSLVRYMLTARSLGMLVLALTVACVFAVLSQWQLDRAVTAVAPQELTSEVPGDLVATVAPNAPMGQSDTGRMMSVTGSFVTGDYNIVGNRLNKGESGFWVVGHFITETGPSVAVARGWAPDYARAGEALDQLARGGADRRTILGRFLPSQAPEIPDAALGSASVASALPTMSVAELANLWNGFETVDVFTGYLVALDAPQGLVRIDAPPPEQGTELNWLNIFYALEWLMFAGFAFFLWYRLVRDSWLRDRPE